MKNQFTRQRTALFAFVHAIPLALYSLPFAVNLISAKQNINCNILQL
jgi:hypothetical protein